MTDLIDDLFNCIPANTEIRNYKSYQQHRRIIEVRLTKKGKVLFHWRTRWAFTILAFRETEGRKNDTCFVAKSEGGFEEVLMDDLN